MNCYGDLNIVSLEELKNLGDEEYNKAKNYGIKQNSIAIAKGHRLLLTPSAYELVFTSSKLQKKSFPFKCVVAANVAFANDTNFIKVLIEKGYTYRGILRLIDFIYKVEKANDNAEKLDIKEEIEIGKRYIRNIRNIMKTQFGITDFKLISNKLIQIAVFEKDLYLSLQKEKETGEGAKKPYQR